jgi:hypothetical protein
MEGGGIVEGVRGDFFMLARLLSWLLVLLLWLLVLFDLWWRLIVLSRVCPGSY